MSKLINGIDISNWQKGSDISKAKNAGYEYIILKTSEGKGYTDPYMPGWYEQARKLGMKVGAYHFLNADSGASQAKKFVNIINNKTWDICPVLDIELDDLSSKGLTNSQFCNIVIDFIKTYESLCPMPLCIYTYTSYIPILKSIASQIKDYPLWIANYNGKPDLNLNNHFFTKCVGHQWTEKGTVPGITTKCDVDVFTEGILIKNNQKVKDGYWKVDNKGWWYRYPDGTYPKDEWAYIYSSNKNKNDTGWYLFDSEGYMLMDWQKDGNDWYYLDDGKAKTGWYYDKDNYHAWFYFDENCKMVTGWLKYQNDWYYLNKDGTMATGWIKDGGYDYCLYSSGKMIHDCDLYGYRFNSKGQATKL